MEGESSEFKCICCGRPVVRSDARRRVGGPSSKRLIPIFLEFFRTVFHGCTFLPRDFCADSRLFWCKGCFSKLEKVLKVREDGKKLEEEIVEHIKSGNCKWRKRKIGTGKLKRKTETGKGRHNT